MRVAYVCSDVGVPVFGCKGASVHVQAVLRALIGRGAEVHLFAARLGGDPPPDLATVRVSCLPVRRTPDAADDELAARRTDAAAAAMLDELHAQRAIDLVYERYSLWGVSATSWARRHGVPSLLEVNAPLIDEQATHRVLHDRHRAESAAVQAFSAASAIICVSEEIAAWVGSRTSSPHRVHTIGNGVDTARVRPSGRVPVPATGGPFTIGFTGTFKPWHGVSTLLEAARTLSASDPSYRFLLVGDGPQAGPLREQARLAGLSRVVEMTAAVDPSAVPNLLHRMDVAVAPYPPLPGFYFSPLKITEYLAAGLPTVASRVGQVAEILDHGRAGVLVAPGDSAALAAAIAALRADPVRRGELSEAGRQRAVSGYEWTAVVGRALALVGLDRRPALEVAHGRG